MIIAASSCETRASIASSSASDGFVAGISTTRCGTRALRSALCIDFSGSETAIAPKVSP